MSNYQYQIIVIGGGPAGITAALRARELGASVALVERGLLGGTCTNDGCAPTRVLAKAARLLRDTEQFAQYGLEGCEVALNWEQLLDRTHYTVNALHEKKQLIDHLQQSGAEVYINADEAHFVDAHTIALQDGTTLTAEKFILCVGGHARRIDFPGAEYAITHSDIWRLRRLPHSIAIVGAAATGCQLATCLSTFGVRVTLLEVAPRILAIEDESISQAMTNAFRRCGVEIVTGISGVQRIDKQADGLDLVYTLHDQPQTVRADAVLLAVGWTGNVEALNLDAAGVKAERGRIQVSDSLQTSAPHIFAAGDITGRMMLVQSANDEGRVAAESAVIGVGERDRHLIVPHGGFTDPEYASVGLTEAAARAKEECVVAIVPYHDMDRAVIDAHTEGFCKLIVSQETHRILGSQVVGEQALEIIQLVAAGMAAGMWVEDLAQLEIAYPTYTAIVGLAARRVCEQLGVIPLAQQWRTLGRIPQAEWEASEA